MSLSQTLASTYLTNPTTFTVGNTTLAKIIVPRSPAAIVLPTIAGLDVNQAALTLTGGCRVIGGQITSTDSANKTLMLYTGHRCTANSGVSTPLAVGSSSTITRSTGSFLQSASTAADNNGPGWQIGDTGMLFYTGTAANNGLLFIVTGVAAGTLTVNGTPLTTDASPGAATELYRVSLRTALSVPLGSGNSSSVPPAQLLGSSQDVDLAAQPDRGISLGPDDVLIGAMLANISALPAYVSVAPHLAQY